MQWPHTKKSYPNRPYTKKHHRGQPAVGHGTPQTYIVFIDIDYFQYIMETYHFEFPKWAKQSLEMVEWVTVCYFIHRADHSTHTICGGAACNFAATTFHFDNFNVCIMMD